VCPAPVNLTKDVPVEIWQAIILGAVQGLTEFMPISSSAHLILVPRLMGWPELGLSFDVALHIGTLVALLAYFWRDWLTIGRDWLTSIRVRRWDAGEARLGWLIILGSIPAGVAGLLVQDLAETVFRDIRIIGVNLIILGLLLFLADRTSRGNRDLTKITWVDSVLVGLAQALALIPGVSRSGSTLTMGLFRGLRRDTAARFSFLLGTPITAAAAAQQMIKTVRTGLPPSEQVLFLVGIVSSAVFGFLTIAFLLSYLRTRSTGPFVVYRVVLGVSLLALVAIGFLPARH